MKYLKLFLLYVQNQISFKTSDSTKKGILLYIFRDSRYFDPSKMTIFWKKDWGELRDFSSCELSQTYIFLFVYVLTIGNL